MRFIAIALLALLVCTTVMAADNYYIESGGLQSYIQTSSGEGNVLNTINGKTATQLDISATVDWWVYDSLENSKIVFRFINLAGDPLTVTYPVAAEISGHVDTTIAGWFSVLGDGTVSCDLTKMKSGANIIPVAWDISMDGGSNWMGTSFVNNEVRSATTVAPGSYDYVWKITATATAMQAPGTYTLDPYSSFVPSL